MPPAAHFPSLFLPRDAVRIERDAATADRDGWLSMRQQALLHRRGWLRMLAPRAAGGLELSLPAAVRLEEQVAAIDGSMAWVLTLCAGAGWFAGFLPPAMARIIIGTRRLCVAGSGAPTGYADLDPGQASVRLTGRWDYASGAPMATHFTVNAVLRQHGEILRDDAGMPRVRAFIVPAALAHKEPSWRSIGLRASASHSYRFTDTPVDAGCGFRIDPAAATSAGPLYQFPFMALAYVTLSANLAGMGSHFLALAGPAIAARRVGGQPLIEAPGVAARLSGARANLDRTRARFYALLDAGWDDVAGGAPLSVKAQAELREASLALAEAARLAVDGIYPFCGLVAAGEGTPINRVWRDFHTATQHSLLLPV